MQFQVVLLSVCERTAAADVLKCRNARVIYLSWAKIGARFRLEIVS
jgi:hypothetical protein